MTLSLTHDSVALRQRHDARAGDPPAAATTAAVRTVRPALARSSMILLLILIGALYLWDLSASGYANSFYSAAAQAGSQSWEAWFYGALDSANSITVDKPPAAIWIMGLSVRIFGLSSWSILVPEALLGVATAGVLYATIRRVLSRPPFGVPAGAPGLSARAHWAGLVGAATFALTPVATLMFRFNNPDALLVFLLTLASYLVLRGVEAARARWLVGAGVAVGFAFLTKMLQAFLVLPAFAAAYLVAAPVRFSRRVLHLLGAFAAMTLTFGWYVALVELVPTSWRPYIGGSQTNSLLELIIGYNGLGRLSGDETGSVGGGAGAGGNWGQTGILRMFDSVSGGMVSWLIPAALLLTVIALIVVRRRRRTDVARAALIVFAGTLVVTAAVFSFMAGIYHDYYTVALAPAIGGTVAIGWAMLWAERAGWLARAGLGGAVAASTGWAVALLTQAPEAYAALRWPVLIGGVLATAGLLVIDRLPRLTGGAVLVLALTAGLTGPAAYSLNTAITPHTGSIVTAGPVSGGGPGGAGGPVGGARPGNAAPQAQPPNPNGGASQSQTGGAQPGGDMAGGMGGLINGQQVDTATAAGLSDGADTYTWMAATIGAQNAASYQLATQLPVMSIGGFNGTDPSPTLTEFQALVAKGEIHWFIPGGQGGNASSGSDAAQQIQAWVQQNFTQSTVGSLAVYDLTAQK